MNEKEDKILEKAGYWKYGFHTHSKRLYDTFIRVIKLTREEKEQLKKGVVG